MKYRVIAERTTVYEGEADDGEHAIDEMMEGTFKEVDQETNRITAEPLCSACDTELTKDTTREIQQDDETFTEGTWCPKCRREVSV